MFFKLALFQVLSQSYWLSDGCIGLPSVSKAKGQYSNPQANTTALTLVTEPNENSHYNIYQDKGFFLTLYII